MSLVYKSPSTGKLYTIEAHIELGVIAKPLTANIAEMNSRDAVFRFQDQKAAHLAAQYMYFKALAISKTGKNIDYDFSMNMKDTHSLFCSEVVSSGFSHSSKGKIEIPMFKSSLTERNLNFEHAINVYQNDSFLPGDIEIDPRFTMIAEWKDWSKMRDLHEKDAILRSMLSWMNDKNYQFDQSKNSSVWFKKNIGYAMRRIPLIDLLVKDKMPLNMSRDLIGLFTILDQVGGSLQFILQQYNDLYIQKTGGTLPSQEWMMSVLEVVREKDSKAETPIFHQRFHPL